MIGHLTREDFLAKVRETFPEDGEDLAALFGWLFDLRENDPDEYHRVLADACAEAGHEDLAAELRAHIGRKAAS